MENNCMPNVPHFFVNGLPSPAYPHSIYFVLDSPNVLAYVTGSDGVPHLFGSGSYPTILHNSLPDLQGGTWHFNEAEHAYLAEIVANDTIAELFALIGTGGTYQGASPTTISLGGIPVDYVLTGKTYQEIIEDLLVVYLDPAFSSFVMSGQATTVEVGTTISGSKSFAFTATNTGNIQSDSLSVIDVTNNTTLVSGQPFTSPVSANVGSVTKTTPASHQWKGRAINTNSEVIDSNNFTVNWQWRVYNGTSANPTLTESQIEALTTSALRSGFATTYSFAAGNYKYIAFPDSFGSPTALTGFKDTATNLTVAMASSVDDAFYSNTQNGWSYGIVSVTNTNGVTTDYRVYRTKNLIASTLQIQVS